MGKRLLGVVLVLAALLAGVCASAWGQERIRLVVNGREIQPDVPPQIINGRMMVPLRAVAEALGADERRNENNQTIEIESGKCQKNPRNTCADLTNLLWSLRTETDWVKMYELNRFDCSNMAALLDFLLDKDGYNSMDNNRKNI